MIPLLLTGPAGSGKTFRCLAEIGAQLRNQPQGAPLILLAPRQATYQLERQILSLPGVEGFTRLRILSFQRLAQYVFEVTGQPEPNLLDEEGRVMVLRAILGKRKESLQIYGASAGRDGLAQEFSDLWRELCEHNIAPRALRAAVERVSPNPRLRAKLCDFADVFEDYAKWLDAHQLKDADSLLDLAADAALKGPLPRISGFWLDGFAQMTPQERRLLTAVLRACDEATLAFCLPQRPLTAADGFSMWSVLSRTYCQLRTELQQIFRETPREESLARRKSEGRFDRAPMLAHLEQSWGAPCPFGGEPDSRQVRVVQCANLEAEAIFTAREILKFARAGGRFREAAVLVRSLDGAHDILQRVFHRYGIPTFIDRREAVAHHPVAELTRGALRAIAFGYQQHELFCAFKSGLSGVSEADLDWFENMALARGWHGEDWRSKLHCGSKAKEFVVNRAEHIRKQAFKPIFQLHKNLGPTPSGAELANALREFWTALDVEGQLSDWAEASGGALHNTVWTQMEEWLGSIELAFADERMSLNEWLGIVDAGLGSLTVGLIPPALDQTLIGAVDRSRNPDLKAVFLIGVNEAVFPKRCKERLLMNDGERATLEEAGFNLAATSLGNVGAEQFYGYIACTRARESLTVTHSETDPGGQPLNPSIFIFNLQRLFPKLQVEKFTAPEWTDAEAPHELDRAVFSAARQDLATPLRDWEVLKPAWQRAGSARIDAAEKLNTQTVAALYGNTLKTSVSRLEQFAMCPFRFFVSTGLRAEERLVFELDKREEGSFQHEILAEFHRRVEKLSKQWRDLSFEEARDLVLKIASDLKSKFQDGLVEATPGNRFRAEAKVSGVLEFLRIYLQLLKNCEFTPRHVELNFGDDGPLPVWVLQIDAERRLEFSGRIDRVDIWEDEAARRCYAAIFDYKSSRKELDRKLIEHAIQQQLPAYLAALQKNGASLFPFPLQMAGAFYVNLRLKVSNASRAEADDAIELKQTGVFDWSLKNKFDPQETRALFDYTKEPTAGGALRALPPDQFAKLLVETENRLQALGKRIFDGEIAIKPYRHKNRTPCDLCFYASICRIDPWTHPFEML